MPATGEGMPADDAVELDAPEPALRPALSAARRGEWEPAAALLARTRSDADWDRRSEYVADLADCAVHHVGWFDDWTGARPGDPDAALVRAELAIRRAWEIRTAARARHVSSEQFRAFRTVLKDATPALRVAADLNPDDPGPWKTAIAHAMGLGAPREVFDEYLAEGRARDPFHVALHSRAVQYLAAKWYGSHTEMFDFAESAAAAAPAGSLLKGLPMRAVTEYAVDFKAGDRRGPVPWSRVQAITAAGLALSTAYGPGDRDAAGFRNHLALALIRSERADRHAESLEVFRLIGPHARSFPWAYLGDPREIFLVMRKGTRTAVAAATPLRRTARAAGRATTPGHATAPGHAPSVHPHPAHPGPNGADRAPGATDGAGSGMYAAAHPGGSGASGGHGASDGSGASGGSGTSNGSGGASNGSGASNEPGARGTFRSHAIALAAAPLRELEEAVLLTGTTLRLAPAPGGRTFVEAAPSADAGRGGRPDTRALLLGEGDLVRLARLFSRGERWPVVVAAQRGDSYALTVLRDGRELAGHLWPGAAEMPTQEEAAKTAVALAAALGVADHRPLTAALRSTGDPRRHLDDAFSALGLPPLPDGFGNRPEPLSAVPGARVMVRRSFWAAVRETFSSGSDDRDNGTASRLPPLT
ncbi:hypothetical protein [Streptomyces cavernae]|uniref:hypothetical protein n=1 Tax=Streptomyces cavernae TaxID=2259034 RepID=UPI000FEB9D71|nr:hypothetical protein [Streptomyces cavernae]